MSMRDALSIIEASFAELSAWQTAEARILSACTANQKRLYARLPFMHRTGFLKSIAQRSA